MKKGYGLWLKVLTLCAMHYALCLQKAHHVPRFTLNLPLLVFFFSLFTFHLSPFLSFAGHFSPPTPTPYAVSFIGNFNINSLPTQPGDEVAFFDPQGILCGLSVVHTAGQYGTVSVYGDDSTTPDKDEGALSGDILTVKIWDSQAGTELEGSALTLTAGSIQGYAVPSFIPPVWQDKASYVLNIDTATHYIPPNPTAFNNACDYIGTAFTIKDASANIGDEIAVFNSDNILVGHTRINIPGLYGPIHVYGDAATASGSHLSFMVWDKSDGMEYTTSSITFTAGPRLSDYYLSSTIPPVWTNQVGYVLNMDVPKNINNRYTANLNQGWNFISIPVQPANASIVQVLKDISSSVYIAWSFDNEQKIWLKYFPSASTSTLTSIESGKGYWIYMNATAQLTVTGTDASPAVRLYEGWNLIGYSGVDNAGIETRLPRLNDNWSIIWNWSNSTWKLNKNSTAALIAPSVLSVPALTKLNRGKAYWIKTKTGAGIVDWIQ
jgi:hypothetical protein